MQKTPDSVRHQAHAEYRERLSPSLWGLVSAAIVAPMAALVFAPLDTAIALVVGVVVGIALIALLVMGSPVVTVRDGILSAGRAHISVDLLGTPTILTGDDAREARGTRLDHRAWHVIRGGIDGVAIIPVNDEDDPAPYWLVSSRTPDRLAAALKRAQSRSGSI